MIPTLVNRNPHHPHTGRVGPQPEGRSSRALHSLANLYGVQTAYYDTNGQRRSAAPESLLTALRLLGAPVASLSDVPTALRARHQTLWQQGIEPVTVVWDGVHGSLDLCLPQAQAHGSMSCHLYLETGDVRSWNDDVNALPTLQITDVEGVSYVRKSVPLPTPIPLGYHHCTIDTARHAFRTLLISAPKRAYPGNGRKDWGIFVPLYALHSERSWGGGDFTDLEALMTWVAELGGGVVGILPLLSAFLDMPCDPSPYAPASRLFWNEFYIDVTRAPGLSDCPAAQNLLRSTAVQEALISLRAASMVDYRRQMALKRQVLEKLAQWFFTLPSERQREFRAFLHTYPQVANYAGFRAVGERRCTPWSDWPPPLCDGGITEADYDVQARDYHLYAQWVAYEQLKTASSQGKEAGVRLYLDLPLGVHADSYDIWREREIFARHAATGAPPDSFFTRGQNWGFPPLHPEAIRSQGYRYCIDYLRHQFRHAGLLRIDHVMGLHRLFWIPHGFDAMQGVYIRYAAAEQYAILNLESHRHQVCLVGENLGTVPAYVNKTMARHHLHRMYVAQYELASMPDASLPPVPRDSVASLNTHDMMPFMAYWKGLDIADRLQQGLLEAAAARRQRRHRQTLLQTLQSFLRRQGMLAETSTQAPALLRACLDFLSTSPCRVVLVTLEDLWLETEPQNRPGTGHESPNWQRKIRYSLESFRRLPQVLAALRQINRLRRAGAKCRTRSRWPPC